MGLTTFRRLKNELPVQQPALTFQARMPVTSCTVSTRRGRRRRRRAGQSSGCAESGPPSSIQNSAVSFSPARKASMICCTLCTLAGGWQFCTLRPITPGAAREHALALAVKAHPVVLVDVLKSSGQRREHEVELLQGEPAGLEFQQGPLGGGRTVAARPTPAGAGGPAGAGTAASQRRSRSRLRRRGSPPTRHRLSVSSAMGKRIFSSLVTMSSAVWASCCGADAPPPASSAGDRRLRLLERACARRRAAPT